MTHNYKDMRVHTFPDGINPKVNIIVRMDFELAFFEAEFQHLSHYAARTYPGYILDYYRSSHGNKLSF